MLNVPLIWYAPPFKLYSSVPVPPLAVTTITPSDALAQLICAPLKSDVTLPDPVICEGWKMLTVYVSYVPFTSVAVSVYAPTYRLAMSRVDAV